MIDDLISSFDQLSFKNIPSRFNHNKNDFNDLISNFENLSIKNRKKRFNRRNSILLHTTNILKVNIKKDVHVKTKLINI